MLVSVLLFAAGLFLGTSVHETAQVAGSGLVYQQYYGDPQALVFRGRGTTGGADILGRLLRGIVGHESPVSEAGATSTRT